MNIDDYLPGKFTVTTDYTGIRIVSETNIICERKISPDADSFKKVYATMELMARCIELLQCSEMLYDHLKGNHEKGLPFIIVSDLLENELKTR